MKNPFKGFGEWVKEGSPRHQREIKIAELKKKLAGDEAYLGNVGADTHRHGMNSAPVSHGEKMSDADVAVEAVAKRVAEMKEELKALEEEAGTDQ